MSRDWAMVLIILLWSTLYAYNSARLARLEFAVEMGKTITLGGAAYTCWESPGE